jgi:hypothetical protein
MVQGHPDAIKFKPPKGDVLLHFASNTNNIGRAALDVVLHLVQLCPDSVKSKSNGGLLALPLRSDRDCSVFSAAISRISHTQGQRRTTCPALGLLAARLRRARWCSTWSSNIPSQSTLSKPISIIILLSSLAPNASSRLGSSQGSRLGSSQGKISGRERCRVARTWRASSTMFFR